METEGSLPHSQDPATCPYHGLVQSSAPHPTSWRYILILSSHLCLGLQSGLFPSVHSTKPCLHLSSPHLIIHDFSTRITFGEYRSLSSSLCSLLHSPVTSSLLGPNILLNSLFSNTLSLRTSLNVSDQVPHPYKTTYKIIVLYIYNFVFLDNKLEDKRFCTKW